MTRARTFLAAALLWLLAAVPALAQTAPGWTFGYVPTTAQWNAIFASKQDYLGAPPLLTTGGTMVGPLVTSAATAGAAGLNVPPGTTPSSPNAGDVWTDNSGIYARINGVTYNLILGSSVCPLCAQTNLANDFAQVQTIDLGSGAAPAVDTGTALGINGGNAVVSRVENTAFGAASVYSTRYGGGTRLSPTAPTSATLIGSINAHAYDGTTWTGNPGAALHFYADGSTWTNASHPGEICLATTPTSAITGPKDGLCQRQDGGITINGASSLGAGSLNATNNLNGSALFQITNNSTGVSALTGLGITNSSGGVTFGLGGTGYTGQGSLLQNKAFILATGGSSIALYATGAVPIDFYINSSRVGGFTSAGIYQTNGAINVTSASSTALAVGLNGTTNPALQVDTSVSLQATGVVIQGGAAGSSPLIRTISSNTNEGLQLSSKGTGSITLMSTTASVTVNLGIPGAVAGVLAFSASTAGSQNVSVTGTAAGGTAALPIGSYNILGDTIAATLTSKTMTASSNVLGGVTMTLGSDATGDIYYRNSSGFLTRLPIGSNGQVLQVNTLLPSWQAGSSAGSVTVGSTTIASGAASNLLYNNAGTLGNATIASFLTANYGISLTGTTNAGLAVSLTNNFTTLNADVAMGSANTYATGPCAILNGGGSCATAGAITGTWRIEGYVGISDTAGTANVAFCRITDGTTTYATTSALRETAGAGQSIQAILFVTITSPAGNPRMDCQTNTTTGVMRGNQVSTANSGIIAVRIQ